MSFYSQSIEINRPKLDEEEVWYRNQYNKNWGNLYPLKFVNGHPIILLPPIKSIAMMTSCLCIVIALGFRAGLHPLFSFAFALAQISLYIIATKYTHQIASSGIPILNQQEFYNYRGFCRSCLVFTGQQEVDCVEKEKKHQNYEIRHCQECGTCFYDHIYHSKFLGLCITDSNFWRCMIYQTIFFLSTLFMISINFF